MELPEFVHIDNRQIPVDWVGFDHPVMLWIFKDNNRSLLKLNSQSLLNTIRRFKATHICVAFQPSYAYIAMEFFSDFGGMYINRYYVMCESELEKFIATYNQDSMCFNWIKEGF